MNAAASDGDAGLTATGIPLALEPKEARLATELPGDDGWQFEPKWDGFRCLAFKAGDEVEIKAKSGKSLSRLLPEAVANVRAVAEVGRHRRGAGDPGRGTLSFTALQARLHSVASRIERLYRETPATLIVFDCLLRKARHGMLPKASKLCSRVRG